MFDQTSYILGLAGSPGSEATYFVGLATGLCLTVSILIGLWIIKDARDNPEEL